MSLSRLHLHPHSRTWLEKQSLKLVSFSSQGHIPELNSIQKSSFVVVHSLLLLTTPSASFLTSWLGTKLSCGQPPQQAQGPSFKSPHPKLKGTRKSWIPPCVNPISSVCSTWAPQLLPKGTTALSSNTSSPNYFPFVGSSFKMSFLT